MEGLLRGVDVGGDSSLVFFRGGGDKLSLLDEGDLVLRLCGKADAAGSSSSEDDERGSTIGSLSSDSARGCFWKPHVFKVVSHRKLRGSHT